MISFDTMKTTEWLKQKNWTWYIFFPLSFWGGHKGEGVNLKELGVSVIKVRYIKFPKSQ